MKITFADSFWKSLKKLNRRNTWWYKTYFTLKYDLPGFFRNIWLFRKDLWAYRGWDYTFMLYFMETCLKDMSTTIEKYGNEVPVSRMKKVDKMIRARQIIVNITQNRYTEMAEAELGELQNFGGELFNGVKETPEQEAHNTKVISRAYDLEEQEWNELWQIFKGQDYKDYEKSVKHLNPIERSEQDTWNKWFNGSDMRGWWD